MIITKTPAYFLPAHDPDDTEAVRVTLIDILNAASDLLADQRVLTDRDRWAILDECPESIDGAGRAEPDVDRLGHFERKKLDAIEDQIDAIDVMRAAIQAMLEEMHRCTKYLEGIGNSEAEMAAYRARRGAIVKLIAD